MEYTRRGFHRLAGVTAGALALGGGARAQAKADVEIEIAPIKLQIAAKKTIDTVAYNGQVPGPLIRLRQGRKTSFHIRNRTAKAEVLHWHGLYLPPEIDGAMEEGTPMIEPGAEVRYEYAADPPGFRWYHTHTFAGNNMHAAQFGGLHGFLMVDGKENPGAYDQEVFLALHDWDGYESHSDDASMSPLYNYATINGKTLGFGPPIQVREGQRVLMQVLNSSPTEVHSIALAGHAFQVLALDGNAISRPVEAETLQLCPAERVTAMVTMKNPGVWVLGETSDRVRMKGMGIVVEYAGAAGAPQWNPPSKALWDYSDFAQGGGESAPAEEMRLVIDSRFRGHGSEEEWTINGKSYPHTEEPELKANQRYRLLLENRSADSHPIHLHRHTFEVKKLGGGEEQAGLMKDVVLIPPNATSEIAFTADHPGRTLFHCHQQNHMDRGFMMLFRYA